MKLQLQIGLTAALLASTGSAQAQTRFQNMDSDNDGVITRAEWRGNAQSFHSQDWNGDGVLSGNEVVAGTRRPAWNQDWNRDGRVDALDNQIAQWYRSYDANGDNRVARVEWPGDGDLFSQLDANRDGYVTIAEYTNGAGFNRDGQGGPAFRFSNVDLNGDGWLTRNEWSLGSSDFTRLDANRDNRISRFEFDNVAATSDPNRSHAWRMGRDRGVLEGRVAGREDWVGHQRFDLDGQRELERADSGYTAHIGSLSDYQAGYREGFREAYREGFDAARGSRK